MILIGVGQPISIAKALDFVLSFDIDLLNDFFGNIGRFGSENPKNSFKEVIIEDKLTFPCFYEFR